MSILEIVEFPEDVLSETAEPVKEMNDSLLKLVEDMTETMYAAPGVGIAANQVGVPKRIAVIDTSVAEEKDTIVIINPEIVEMSDDCEKMEEGCLSVPEYKAEVERALRITVLAKNLKGEDVKIKAEGFLARVFQHEIDHLNGTLFIDRIGKLKRKLYVRQRKKALTSKN